MFKEWVIDIGMPSFQDDMVTFIPYDRENDQYITGMNFGGRNAPGRLVGIVDTFATDEDNMLDRYNAFIKKHPDWMDKFKSKKDITEQNQ